MKETRLEIDALNSKICQYCKSAAGDPEHFCLEKRKHTVSVHTIFTVMAKEAMSQWNSDLVGIEFLQQEHPDRHEGGGLAGVDPLIHKVRGGLLDYGHRLIKLERMEQELERDRGRGRVALAI